MLLVIETAFDVLSVAMIDGQHVIAEHHTKVGHGHAESLLPAVAQVVGEAGASLTAILVDIGPGSFTGLRIGIAAARALGLAWEIPVTGVGSLTLIAGAAFTRLAEDTIAVVADAGRGQVYWQVFDRGCLARGQAMATAPAAVMLPPGLAVTGSGAAFVSTGSDTCPGEARASDARFVPPEQRALLPAPLYSRGPILTAA